MSLRLYKFSRFPRKLLRIYTSAVNVEEVIEGVMTRMLPVFQQMVDAVTPALPQPQSRPKARPAAAEEPAAEADAPREGVYIPDAENAVVFTAKGADLESAYGELSRAQKGYYNKLKDRALALPDAMLYSTAQHEHVKIGRRSVIKLMIRRGAVIAQFMLENDTLRSLRASETQIRIRPVEIVVDDDAAFRTALEMIDLAGKQIARDKEEAKERRKQARRKKK